MPNLSDSCRVKRFPVSVRQLARDAEMSFPLSLRAFLRDARCPHRHCLTLHLKLLTEEDAEGTRRPVITGGAVRDMLMPMRRVYETADIGVTVGSREELGEAFDALVTVDVDTCGADGDPTTGEQNQLFANRSGAAADDVVIYFVRDTNPAFNGCANHPEGQPGAVVAAAIASRWTLAHEICHVLGLSHIAGERDDTGACVTPDFTRLMTGCSTDDITGTPTLSAGEIATMQSSPSIHDCPR